MFENAANDRDHKDTQLTSMLEKYSVVLNQDIIWGDMDALGHINNTVYFRYFEDARLAYFEKSGIKQYQDKTNIGPILANTECNFRLPLQYPDKIHIAGRASILSPKKFKMDYLVVSENMDGIAAEGHGLLVYYDYNAGKSCQIPDSIVAAINSLEVKG